MSVHLGDRAVGSVVYHKFTTFRPSTGAAYTLAGTPVVKVYKNADATEVTTGATITADYDGKTGLCHVAIDTSADGIFYDSGSEFTAFLSAGTIDGVSVANTVLFSFTLNKATVASVAGQTLANLDAASSTLATATNLATVAGYIDTEIGTIITNLAAVPTAAQNATELLDQANAIETGWTVRGILRVMSAVLCGKLSGAATATNTFRDTNDTKNRVISTCDADGNRSAVTLDGT